MSQTLRREKLVKKRWSSRRIVSFSAGIILALALALGAVGMLLIFRTTPTPIIHTDPMAARRLVTELDQAQQSARAGKAAVIRADETEINSMFGEYLANNTSRAPASDMVVRDMKITLAEDRLKLYILAHLGGRDVTLQLEGRLRAVNGYMDFDVTAGKIGSLPLPKASLKNAMQRMLATQDGLNMMRLPSNVRDLHVENGKLIVVFA